MSRRKNDGQNLAIDIVNACNTIDRATAVKGVRNLCRYFGGAMYYIPSKKKSSETMKDMYDVLNKAVGERNANIILEKFMAIYGHFQVYIPIEVNAFEAEIADEIYKRSTEENARITDMAHDYHISFSKVYKLWRLGRRNKINREKKR